MNQDYQAMVGPLDAAIEEKNSIPGDDEIACGNFNEVEAIAKAVEGGNLSAPFEEAALVCLREYKQKNVPGWIRLRDRLKKAGASVTELDKQMRSGNGAPPDDDQSVADRLISLARNTCQFMHDAQLEPYAVFQSGGARQVYRVGSNGFSDYLSHLYYKEYDRAPSESSLKVALATLRGQSQFDGELCEVNSRIAKTPSGYWLDLCNDAWQCVLITATGWSVMAGEGTPLFPRSSSMRDLPVPQAGGSLDALWPLINIPAEDRLMILAWMLECLRPDTPHVVLELVGEQGSVKSTTQKFLRRLIDPNQADLRSAPKSVEDVWIAARNSHIVSLENLSHLASPYQDALCVLATGGGFSTRTLYTNAEETILHLRKPIVLNGISVIVTAQDLLDRCLHIDLPTIHARELSSDIETRFYALQPKLLGALLDLFAKVLAMLPTVKIAPENLPRMADFGTLGEAIFRVSGRDEGEFLSQYNNKRRDGVHRTLDSSPVGAALLAYLSEVPRGWNGTLTDLLNRLERFRPSGEAWPKAAKGLGDALRRLAPALRLIGYECKSDPKTGGSIRWHIFPMPQQSKPCPASPTSPIVAAVLNAVSDNIGISAGHQGHAVHEINRLSLEKNTLPSELEDSEVF